MKKIFTIARGQIIFGMILSCGIILEILSIFLLPKIEGIVGLLTCGLLFTVILILHVKWHFINYIIISPNGVGHKNNYFNWDEVYISMDYTTPTFYRNAYVYRIYFDNKYLTSKEALKNADKKGFCIDLNKKRLELLLSFYHKKIYVFKQSPQINKEKGLALLNLSFNI